MRVSIRGFALSLSLSLSLSTGLAACGDGALDPGPGGEPDGGPAADAAPPEDPGPDYAIVFDSARVHRIDVVIEPAIYQMMQDDLAEVLEEGGDGGGSVDLLARDPIYVPVEIRYEGEAWPSVGMRYKGNSSLALGRDEDGQGKLGFRLDFDEFEAQVPEIEDQRFFGFKKLTFSSNWNDDSQIRDAFVAEVLRDRGVPAARCAFYRVYVDAGDGPTYWGLYTAIEDPSDDAMLDAQLGGAGGNLYKPEGDGATWASFDETSFAKKTNQEAADWSDAAAAVAALHADDGDAAAWRAGLEATFDVDRFLTWLAVNTAIVNWDVYGALPHNYYLYAPPGSAVLGWIPWDHNLSMMNRGFGGGGGGQTAASEMFHARVSADEWPLIGVLLADPIYRARYADRLEHALGGLFAVDAASARMRELHALIEPFVVGVEGELPTSRTIRSEQAFRDAIDGDGGLVDHIAGRHARVAAALDP